jgi:hypothetical protein
MNNYGWDTESIVGIQLAPKSNYSSACQKDLTCKHIKQQYQIW